MFRFGLNRQNKVMSQCSTAHGSYSHAVCGLLLICQAINMQPSMSITIYFFSSVYSNEKLLICSKDKLLTDTTGDTPQQLLQGGCHVGSDTTHRSATYQNRVINFQNINIGCMRIETI